MTEKNERQEASEVESLNPDIVEVDDLSDEDLEEAAGGGCGVNLCGTFSEN